MKVELITTDDGSHSLFREDINETYHSTKGALAESRHVYIDMGLKIILEKGLPATVLEVGFGTGLNAFLTLEYHNQYPMPITYHTLEPYPLQEEVWSKINYTDSIMYTGSDLEFERMHTSKAGVASVFQNDFMFTLFNQKLEEFQATQKYSVIYFDAFAPNKQEEMWDPSQFQRLYDLMEEGGVLTTYCAQGKFKRTLKAVGFEVLVKPGPPGKKQMTLAIKNSEFVNS